MSRYENRVYLDPNELNAAGMPKLKVNFSYSMRDQAVIREMAAVLREIIPQIGFSAEKAPCLVTPGSDYHESGTCRMGDDPAQ